MILEIESFIILLPTILISVALPKQAEAPNITIAHA